MTDATPQSAYDPDERFVLDLPPNEDDSPDDDAPEQDPDPAPPREADVTPFEDAELGGEG